MLRVDAQTDWESLVRDAPWIRPRKEFPEGIEWSKAKVDLSKRLPSHVRERLGFDDSFTDLSPGFVAVVTIAAAERATAKPLNTLRSPVEIKTALDALPGTLAPHLLISLWRVRRLKRNHLQAMLLNVWRSLDHPHAWPMRTWRAMFRCAGFLSDDYEAAPKPTRPLTVYRGCTPTGRRGMSWTTERWIAEQFADKWVELGQATTYGHVYKARVAPGNVLARIYGPQETRTNNRFR